MATFTFTCSRCLKSIVAAFDPPRMSAVTAQEILERDCPRHSPRALWPPARPVHSYSSPTTARTVSLRVIVNEQEADAIRAQAQAEDRTVSDYLRWLAKQHGNY